ncbi:electron transfer flavoprotein subunit beta [Ancylobacter sp. SL191]|uniref:electron transfer flavoprotein subunit beta n=1 Tax=Ancylobacter sp. SL191 TaxID=2995166 RepID=UPI00227075F0|nr:electron transfer flavoprotein subunit beta [Ancylobacter sp. SL191]WAC28948.1 electron transfer flavoprotein subunit beta [Ancylobacter sp. SL191]
MRIVVLLSAGRHRVSGQPAPVPVELQALRLAVELGGEVTVLHAGPELGALADALGHGVGRLDHRVIADGDDPLPSLVAALTENPPDLILAGRSGQGGEDAGLLPYALARALGRPILADAAGLGAGPEAGTLAVEQALPRGARRRVMLRLPALLTVHPAASAPLPFAFAARRRGGIATAPGITAPQAVEIEERPYRPRPKLIAKAASGASAAERLKAATQAAAGGGKLLVDPSPEEAAREILAHLASLGLKRG